MFRRLPQAWLGDCFGRLKVELLLASNRLSGGDNEYGAPDCSELCEAAGAVAEGVVRRCFAKAGDDARAEKGSGRTDVQPLAPPTNKAHLPFDFDDCFFFFAITYSFGLPTPTQNNRALQMNTA